ncbi:MAG: hypothetical protein ABEI74_03120 [Candidatus Pacearchaeota archaeon]
MIKLFSFRRDRKAGVLIQNVIFIVLNLIFISMLMMFLWQQSGSEALIEETYSKKIALTVDSAKPVMEIKINMQDALETSRENGFDFSKVVNVQGNTVSVKLSEKGGHEYNFFNDVSVNAYPERGEENEYTGNYIIVINEPDSQGGEDEGN